jgi:hypothetical protein
MSNPFRELYLAELTKKQKKIDKNHNGKVDDQDLQILRKEDKQDQTKNAPDNAKPMGKGGKVETKKYSWGTMKTVHHGSDFSIPLHPEHHQAIAKLKDQQEHKFKDETGRHWSAKKSGEHVHFQGANGGGTTHVPAHTMHEEVERIEEANPGLYANINAKRKRIAAGSKEHMRKPGSAGAPSAKDFKDAAKTANEEFEQIDELDKSTLKSYINKNIKSGRADDGGKGDTGLYRATNKVAGKLKTGTLDKKVKTLGNTSSNAHKNPYEYDASRSELKNRGIHHFAGRRTRTEELNMEAKDEREYGYEGDMALNQLKTLVRCAEMIEDMLKPDTDMPEWVQSKITLATDYIQTAADYMYSELKEGYYEKPASAYRRKGDEIGGGSSKAPVAPVPDRKYIKGTPEHKAYKATKKPINGMPTCEEVELQEANHREFASQGKMHPNMAKHMSVGDEHDYYEHGTGDKVSGKVMHKSDTEVHMKQTHDSYDPKKKGTVHKFKISDKLDESSVPFDRPYKKIKPVKNSDGTIQSPLSRARELAKAATHRLANKTVRTEETISEEEGFTLHSKHTNPDGTVTITLKSPNGKLVTHKGKNAHQAVKQRYGIRSEEIELEEAKSNAVMCANCKGPLHKGACDDKSTWSKEMNKIKEQKEEGIADKTEVTKHLNKIQSPHQVSILKKIQDMQKKRLEIVDNMPTAGGRSAEVNFREEAIQERLNMDKASMGDVVKDFEKSNAPQFAGKSAEKRREMAVAAKLSKEEVSVISLKSYLHNEETLDEIKMSDLPKRTVKGTSYGAQYHDPEGEDDADNKSAPKSAEEKRGRGRPKGSASGARQKGSGSQTKTGGADYTGYKLHLPNSNR